MLKMFFIFIGIIITENEKKGIVFLKKLSIMLSFFMIIERKTYLVMWSFEGKV